MAIEPRLEKNIINKVNSFNTSGKAFINPKNVNEKNTDDKSIKRKIQL